MRTIQHQIEDAPHSANSIWEYQGMTEEEKKLYHMDGDGFYWVDESEAYNHGPYPTLEEAKAERDKYFEWLNKTHPENFIEAHGQ